MAKQTERLVLGLITQPKKGTRCGGCGARHKDLVVAVAWPSHIQRTPTTVWTLDFVCDDCALKWVENSVSQPEAEVHE